MSLVDRDKIVEILQKHIKKLKINYNIDYEDDIHFLEGKKAGLYLALYEIKNMGVEE